jgi:hypothetical protein
MILRLLCIWLVFLFIVVIADARNHEPEIVYVPQQEPATDFHIITSSIPLQYLH